MRINIADPSFQTVLFTVVLAAAVILTSSVTSISYKLTHFRTNELKGLAILMVVFGHIGYFLSLDPTFLYPLSVASGVGVNVFLFLSGFGLTVSSLKKEYSILALYFKRLRRIFAPMWLVLAIFLIMDLVFLGRSYQLSTIIQNLLGWFPKADIYINLDSPLWYFTLILFYYLIFPLVFSKRYPLFTVLLILLLSFLVLNLNLPVQYDVHKLYKLHFLAFPLGMSFAILSLSDCFKNFIYPILFPIRRFAIVKYLLILLLMAVFGYTAIYSHVGEGIWSEQFTSLITMASLILIVLLLKIQSRFLIILGIYSYEIYLIQWPLMYRYDFLYKYLPAALATSFYILLYLILSFGLKRLINWAFEIFKIY